MEENFVVSVFLSFPCYGSWNDETQPGLFVFRW